MDPKPYNSKKDLKYIQSVLKSIQSDVNLIKKHVMSIFYEEYSEDLDVQALAQGRKSSLETMVSSMDKPDKDE